ncbi:epithelial cell-transforming sequence 2 oncogene-like [Gadus chalcogrammus]|uniref:epithelial cell-transforming sequence 2 oncogene-like n=1 Tax=Gadus chalcogrammus TaxID=1042646 RepID=UPI0024C417C5|nr:epithelial cell-transforming sequence 2 oncogene-like [Gadus chalcogrammus]
METRLDEVTSGSLPHSVKQWQLASTDYELKSVRTPPQTGRTPGPGRGSSGTRFSAWTPLVHKPSNQQLFQERSVLLLHWFDLWSDAQRKQLLHALLTRCSQSQLKLCRDWLMASLPVVRVDFTAVLPRFLGLYVLSFLSPRDLAAAAQVSWHWRSLAEQDCLWSGRCLRRGWFLPYSPGVREGGAWRDHYVSCVSTLDWSPADTPPLRVWEEVEEEEEERRREFIRERLHQEKGERAWGSRLPSAAHPRWPVPEETVSGCPWPSWSSAGEGVVPGVGLRHREGKGTAGSSLRAGRAAMMSGGLGLVVEILSVLLLVSNRIPAYELVMCGTRSEVVLVLYDQRGTLPALLAQLQRVLAGRAACRLGLLCPGGTEELQVVRGVSLSEQSVLVPSTRDFWERMCGWVIPSEKGGGVDIFSPLAASARGVALMLTLSTITGLEVCAPMGLATGSFQNILSRWTSSSSRHLRVREEEEELEECYVHEAVLRGWCLQAQWMEEALGELRGLLGPRLHGVSLEARGRALGHFLWDRVSLEDVCVSAPLTRALIEGLSVLKGGAETRPLRSLAAFLSRRSEEEEEVKEDGQPTDSEDRGTEGGEDLLRAGPAPLPELAQMALDWRGAVVKELYHSEQQYQSRLASVLKVYHEPLTAAVDSNRPIISQASVHVILSPVEQILHLNRAFLRALGPRLALWGPGQCVGAVLLQLCSKLRLYLNYLHQYPSALRAVDECREKIPAFRAFLKRADRTIATHMLSLPELLLSPLWRLEEYVTLLQALSLTTPQDHPDHAPLAHALVAMTRHREFIRKMKSSSERDRLMEETQREIKGCPDLREGDRQLILTQDAALLQSPGEDLPHSLRTYQQVCDLGLFLFNDALVLTKRSVDHAPFSLAQHTTHTFLASVALGCLDAREITHSRYVHNAFILEGPSRSWACSTERAEDSECFLSALRSAALAALTPQG